jgi:hypothetical protein
LVSQQIGRQSFASRHRRRRLKHHFKQAGIERENVKNMATN